MSTDRITGLARALLAHARGLESVTKALARECGSAARDVEQLLASWEAEYAPDGPLFGATARPEPAPQPAPEPRRQARRGHVETVREWWVYRKDTTDRLGTVNATTEPSALARAIEHHGPGVWVCAAREPPCAGEAPVESLKRGEVREELAKAGIDPDAAVARVKEAVAAAGQVEPGGPVDLRHASWDAACTFSVHLHPGGEVRCTWHPDHQYATGCGEPGRLELRGPVSPVGFRAMPIPLGQRGEPLAEVARRRAQEAADCEARRAAGAEGPKQPNWSKARKDDLASGAAKPRKKRKPAKGAASEEADTAPAGKEVAE